jgi:hypothetical protein
MLIEQFILINWPTNIVKNQSRIAMILTDLGIYLILGGSRTAEIGRAPKTGGADGPMERGAPVRRGEIGPEAVILSDLGGFYG